MLPERGWRNPLGPSGYCASSRDVCVALPQSALDGLSNLKLFQPVEFSLAVKPEVSRLVVAFRLGYEDVSEWPETHSGEIDTLRVGRVLWVANYVACFEAEYLRGFVERVAPRLERYLSGVTDPSE